MRLIFVVLMSSLALSGCCFGKTVGSETKPQIISSDASAPVVKIRMMDDGSVDIEGKRYVAGPKLKAKIAEVQQRTPHPTMRFIAPKAATSFKAIAPVIALLFELGILKVGFITEPASE